MLPGFLKRERLRVAAGGGLLLLGVGMLAGCGPTCSDSASACVVVHLDGQGRYDEAVIEWRQRGIADAHGLVDDTVVPGPLTLPIDIEVNAPPFLPAGNVRELGVRLRQQGTPMLVATGAISFTIAPREHATATIPIAFYFERRDFSFANPAPQYAVDLAAADFDGDQKMDLAALRIGQLSVLYGDGAGLLAEGPPATGSVGSCTSVSPCPAKLVAIDVNADLLPDLVMAQKYVSSGLSTFQNPGNRGAFTQRGTMAPMGDFRVLAVGQFDTTPAQEVAVLNTSASTATLLKWNGTSWAQVSVQGTWGVPLDMQALDINQDKFDDLVIADCTDTQPAVDVVFSTGAGTYSAQRTFVDHKTPCFVAVGDFNGTGEAQAMFGMRDEHSLVHVALTPTGGIVPRSTRYLSLSGSGFGSLSTHDVDRDQRPDLLISYLGVPRLGILRNLGSGDFAPLVNLDVTPTTRTHRFAGGPVVSADFDGDGRTDLAMASQASPEVILFLNRTAP